MSMEDLQNAGFAPIRRSPRRMICNVQSIKKSVGKTRFALTAKKPLGYISIEIGSEEGVADSFIKEGMEENQDIMIARIRMEQPVYPNAADFGEKDTKKYDEAIAAAVQAVAGPAMDAFYSAYYASIAHLKTTVLDTGTDLYRLVRLGNFGRTERIAQLSYTAVNNDFAKMFDDAFSSSGNLIVVSHMKDKGEMVENDKGKKSWQATGNYETDGSKVVTDKVQAVIEMWREDLTEENPETGRKVKFNAQIVDSRQNADAMGAVFSDYDVTFADVGMKVFPSSVRSDWE